MVLLFATKQINATTFQLIARTSKITIARRANALVRTDKAGALLAEHVYRFRSAATRMTTAANALVSRSELVSAI